MVRTRVVNRQKYDYQKQIQLYKRAKYLSHAVCCYQNGDEYFHNEYEEYRKIERELEADGYTLEDIEKVQDYYKEHLQDEDIVKKIEKKKYLGIESDIIKQQRTRSWTMFVKMISVFSLLLLL